MWVWTTPGLLLASRHPSVPATKTHKLWQREVHVDHRGELVELHRRALLLLWFHAGTIERLIIPVNRHRGQTAFPCSRHRNLFILVHDLRKAVMADTMQRGTQESEDKVGTARAQTREGWIEVVHPEQMPVGITD
jgi:hypothetical protein